MMSMRSLCGSSIRSGVVLLYQVTLAAGRAPNTCWITMYASIKKEWFWFLDQNFVLVSVRLILVSEFPHSKFPLSKTERNANSVQILFWIQLTIESGFQFVEFFFVCFFRTQIERINYAIQYMLLTEFAIFNWMLVFYALFPFWHCNMLLCFLEKNNWMWRRNELSDCNCLCWCWTASANFYAQLKIK